MHVILSPAIGRVWIDTDGWVLSQANGGAGDRGEGMVEINSTLIVDAKPPEPAKPHEAALYHSPVPPEIDAAVHAASRDSGLGASRARCSRRQRRWS